MIEKFDDRKPVRSWQHQGIDCYIYKGAESIPCFNGYIRLPERWLKLKNIIGSYRAISSFIEAPGGLTYADENGIIGFNTNHYGDTWDKFDLLPFFDNDAIERHEKLSISFGPYGTKWTLDLLQYHVNGLAEDVKEVDNFCYAVGMNEVVVDMKEGINDDVVSEFNFTSDIDIIRKNIPENFISIAYNKYGLTEDEVLELVSHEKKEIREMAIRALSKIEK